MNTIASQFKEFADFGREAGHSEADLADKEDTFYCGAVAILSILSENQGRGPDVLKGIFDGLCDEMRIFQKKWNADVQNPEQDVPNVQ